MKLLYAIEERRVRCKVTRGIFLSPDAASFAVTPSQ